MRKLEICKEIYNYGLVLRALDIFFLTREGYRELWVSPNRGFDIYKIDGDDLKKRLEDTAGSLLGRDDNSELVFNGVLLKPVGWEENGYSIGVQEYIEKEKVVRIKLWLLFPGIAEYGLGWSFSVKINQARLILKPGLMLPRGAYKYQELSSLFGGKRSFVI